MSNTVVFDIGAFEMKFGFDCSRKPYTTRTVLQGDMKPCDDLLKSSFACLENISHYKNLMDHGTLTSFDGLECFLYYAFDTLGIKASDCNVVLSLPILWPSKDSVRLKEFLFEKVRVRSFADVESVQCSMRATGMETGLLVDSGYDDTYIVPVVNGSVQDVRTTGMGGKGLTEFLLKMLKEKNKRSEISNWTADDIKRRYCKVAKLYDQDEAKFKGKDHPEANLDFDVEEIRCPEALFYPRLANRFGGKPLGLSDTVMEVVEKFKSREQQTELYQNIILVGGTTNLPGLEDRLTEDIVRGQGKPQLPLIEPKFARLMMGDPSCATWMGGADLSLNSDKLQNSMIIKEDYQELGNSKNGK